MDVASLVFSTGITSAILQVVIDRLANYVTGLPQFIDRSEDLSKLEEMLHLVKPVVEDVEKKRSMPEACRNLLEDVKSVILDAEDLLDEIHMLQARNSSDSEMGRVLSSRKFNIPGGLSKIHDELVVLKQNLEKYNLGDLGPPQLVTPSSSLVNESSIVGRGTDKKNIIEKVLSEPSMDGDNYSVIPIVGIGGIGKTALAKLVYNDPDVVKTFHFIIWVSVSINYDVMKITQSILDSVKEQAPWSSKLKEAFSVHGSQLDLNTIQNQLKNQLKEKKFLLVLDDMWNEDATDWDTLKLPFQVAAQGSKILMTTRSEVVSSTLSATPAYHLSSLLDTFCWAIIKQTAQRSDAPVDNAICLEIAKKCKGVPLVAKVIGDVMRKSPDATWDSLLKFEVWESPEHENYIYPALKLSYENLASHLKRCFSYCSIFPRDHQFEKDDLVLLWAAEGFIQARGRQEIEDIGREYFGGLCSRLFFAVSHSHGQKSYKMHNLIHDLARLVAVNLSVYMVDNMPASVKPLTKRKHVRYSSLLRQDIDPSILSEFHQYEKLRTFMLLSKHVSSLNQVPYDFFLKLGWLRVLNLSNSLLFELPDSIEFLIHLRYLNLSQTFIKRLPKSAANLYALETLKLMDCFELLELPENLKKLIRLRHLHFNGHRQISSMPMEVGNLTRLQTLYVFVVGRDRGYQIGELKNMNCLCGSICITNLENVTSAVEGEAAMLQAKKDLDKLELEWSRGRAQTAEEDVLESLKPHVGLKELCITGYCALVFPDWIAYSLYSKLEKIELKECVFCTRLPSLGQLPALKHLTIKAMHALENVDQLFSAGSQCTFPLLETLTFQNMPMWNIWSEISETDMPCLEELSMLSCEELKSLPSLHYLKSLKGLEIDDCPKLESLPSEGLPLSMEYLSISGSDSLKERCRVRGADWNKIRLIPSKFIDGLPVQG